MMTQEEVRLIHGWIKSPKNFLIIVGAPGAGKTYLCAAIYDWMIGKVHSMRYWNERQLLQSVRDGIDGNKGDYLKDLSYKIDDDFLIFDDLGSSGTPSEWRKEVLFDMLDIRYSSSKPSIFTSNLTRTEIGKDYGARFASRLFAKENTIIEMHTALDLRSIDVNESK